jgi:hypothetical protein
MLSFFLPKAQNLLKPACAPRIGLLCAARTKVFRGLSLGGCSVSINKQTLSPGALPPAASLSTAEVFSLSCAWDQNLH